MDMKREQDCIMEKKEWLDKTSEKIMLKAFERLRNFIEENQFRYWNDLFIETDEMFIRLSIRETLEETKQTDMEEKYPQLVEELKEQMLDKLAQKLSEYGWKLGQRKGILGIGSCNDPKIRSLIKQKNEQTNDFWLLNWLSLKRNKKTISSNTKMIEKIEEIEELEEVNK